MPTQPTPGLPSRGAFALKPTTRAIRAALALGLVVATPAFAGTCDVSDPAAATCDGIFSGVGIDYAIDDLSLVVGGVLATSIDPGAGIVGIDLYAGNGSIELDSAADISTYGAAGIHVQAPYGDVSVDNNGNVQASNAYGSVTGIDARSYYGDIGIDNAGLVDAQVTGYGSATAVNASNFYGDVTIVNAIDGEVSASTDNYYGGTATAIKARSVIGGSSVVNYGDVGASAIAGYGNATAYGVLNRGGYYGITSVANEGQVSAYASTGDGVGWAWGVKERGRNAELYNSGTIDAHAVVADGYASATASYVRGSYASTSNTGTLFADAEVEGTGQALAYGAMTWGYYASSIDNPGNIEAHASTAQGTAVAMGTSSHYDHASTASNSGTILADGYSGLGFVESMGLYNYALDLSTVYNTADGVITALAEVGNGYAFAYGSWLDAGYLSTLENDGTVSASASVDDSGAFQDYGGMARSIGASVKARYGDAYLDNSSVASITASSDVQGEYGRAYAFGVVVQGGNLAHLSNSGTISAEAYSVAGYAISLGDIAYGTFAVNLNYGSVAAASVVAGSGYAQSIGQYSFGQVSTVVNEGAVSASAQVGYGAAVATGALLYGAYDAAYNYGEVVASAHAEAGDATAYGVAAFGVFGSSIYNAAGATVQADAGTLAGDAAAQGVNNQGYLYSAYVDNAGEISASATTGDGDASAIGVVNIANLYGTAATSNNGQIRAEADSANGGDAEAIGVYSYAYVYGGIAVANAGTIAASAVGQGYANATGIAGVFYDGLAEIDNQDEVSAHALSLGGAYGAAEAVGIGFDTQLGKYNLPEVAVSNAGVISATAQRDGQYGYASAAGVAVNAMYSELYNSGSIEALALGEGYYSGAQAVGVQAFAKYGVADLNLGLIQAQAATSHGGSSSAIGVIASAYYGDAVLQNAGEISADALAGFDGYAAGSAYALGVLLHGDYVVELDNSGTIVASAEAAYGSALARGLVGSSKYDVASLTNAGDIAAVAHAAGGYATAQAVRISSKYGAYVSNEGDIEALAYADDGVATATAVLVQGPGAHGYFDGAIGASLYNAGDIDAFAQAENGLAYATGARVEGAQDAGAQAYNSGTIQATATGGSAYATGLDTWSYYGEVSLWNLGEISAVAGAGDEGAAAAIASITRAQGFGPPAYAAGSASVYNAGLIEAIASAGDGAYATAVVLIGEQGASLDNQGRIVASANGGYGVATAVLMDSQGTATLVNHGEILATGTGTAHVAVYSGIDATAAISNYSYIAGSILTGGRDDTFANHAGATLVLRNDVVDLGGYSLSGNRFDNAGRIVVRGDANLIDMGQGADALLPAPNPYAFVNDGIIDFHDGAADDVLTIYGDLTGHGRILVDVDGAHGTSDQLAIDGNVVAGTVQALDVFFTGLPTTASSNLAIVSVSGDSAVSNFVLGNLHIGVDPGFLDLDFSLDADIDAGNTRDDVFSLNVDVAGLSDAGVLAASVASGAQQLMHSQVGTWRQRMGMRDLEGKGGIGLWARMFQAKGGIDPGHRAADFGQGGNFAFEQKDSGVEAGVEFAVSDELALGLLLAKANASQRLDSPGAGSSRIEGDSVGAYATWVSPNGFYLDASFRTMDFDARMQSLRTEGKASSFNLEAGYAWTLSEGVKLEPQLQFTRTQVDDLDAMTLGASEFRADGGQSTSGRVGLLLSRNVAESANGWSGTPYAVLSAVREFDGENRYAINGDFHGSTSTRGTSALVEAGLSARRGPLAVSFGLNWQDGGAMERLLGGQLNVAYRW